MAFLEEANRFYQTDEEGVLMGEVTFSLAGEHLIIIDHTDVEDAFRGQGVGQKLVKLVVEKARKEDKKIIPLCPFAKSEFDRTPDYHDTLRK